MGLENGILKVMIAGWGGVGRGGPVGPGGGRGWEPLPHSSRLSAAVVIPYILFAQCPFSVLNELLVQSLL